jgi:hypothetical protein
VSPFAFHHALPVTACNWTASRYAERFRSLEKTVILQPVPVVGFFVSDAQAGRDQVVKDKHLDISEICNLAVENGGQVCYS